MAKKRDRERERRQQEGDIERKEEKKEEQKAEKSTKEEVILMGAPAPKKQITEPKKETKTRLFPDEKDTDSKKKEEAKPIEITNNVGAAGKESHINLGRLFLWLAVIFVLFLFFGNIFGWFGTVSINYLSLWPLVLIFIGLLLFKAKTRSGKLLGILVVLALLIGALSLLFRDEGIIYPVLSGETVSEEREAADFTDIVFEGVGDLEVVQGENAGVTIEADKNVLPEITSNVVDGVLTISYKSPLWDMFLFDKGNVSVTVTSPNINAIHFLGKGNVKSESIHTEDLELLISGLAQVNISDIEANTVSTNMSGSGEVTLSGTASSQIIVISGSGTYKGGGLVTDEAGVRLSGSGDVEVHAESLLDVSITGSGTVLYGGSPELREGKVSGSGTIKALQPEEKSTLDPEEFYEKVKPVY